MRDAKIIINPASGGYSVGKEWLKIRKHLRNANLSFDYEYTKGEGHAIEIAKKAADRGYPCIVAVGGDGTINEVVNGILNSKGANRTALGILNAGTACSLARTLGIPHDYAGSCSLLSGSGRRLIDIGLVQYMNRGQSMKRFFVNEADIGFGAEVVLHSKGIPGNLGRSVNYAPFIIAAATSIFSYRNKPLTIRVENEPELNRLCAMMVVANGSYYAGGMNVAPDARLDDGWLDLVTIGDVEISEFVKLWMMSYDGNHIASHKVTVQNIFKVNIESSEKVLVEADGELLGECPVSFEIIPSALTVIA